MEQIVALSQRVEVSPLTDERRDCLDQRWAIFMEKLGYGVIPVPNGLDDPADWFRASNFSGLVLSGGNDLHHLAGAQNVSMERDHTERVLVKECLESDIPVVGVCRGLQMINHFFGGTLTRCEGHAGSRHQLHPARGVDEIWKRPSGVNSYHDWGIPDEALAQDLTPLCLTEDDMVEAFVAKACKVWGIMWHPEREKPFQEIDMELFRMMLGSEFE